MSMLSSGVISSGTSTGATNWFSTIGLGMTLGALAGRAAGGGGGGGGAGAAIGSTKNAFTAEAGSGSWSAESSGTMTIRAAAIVCSARDTGIVFDCCVRWATRSESMRSSKSLLSIAALYFFALKSRPFRARDADSSPRLPEVSRLLSPKAFRVETPPEATRM